VIVLVLARVVLLAALAPVCASSHRGTAPDYGGKFVDHPARVKITADLSSTARHDPEQLPKWLAKRPPAFRVEAQDLAQPLETQRWPGDIDASFELRKEKRDWVCELTLPIDTLIGSPQLARRALKRHLFAASSQARALERGGDPLLVSAWGIENPLIEAMAAHWAGTLDEEIEFVLVQHLGSDEELAALLRPIAPARGPAPEPVPGGQDDLTWLLLVKYLAPEEADKKLEWLYSALESGRSLDAALEKASRLSLEKLNAKLSDSYAEHLEEVFPPKERATFRELQRAHAAGAWSEVLELVGEMEPRDLLLDPSVFHMTVALMELDPAYQPTLVEQLLELSPARSPLALEGMRRGASSLAEHGQADTAREVLQMLRDQFGWLSGVDAEVAAGLEALGK
jgi:hypothetical protein